MKHISEILPAVCNEHGITMNHNQGDEMNGKTKEQEPKVKEALRKATNEIVETLRGRHEAGSLNDHMDFLMGAASAFHQLDVELWGGNDTAARCLPPAFCFAWRYKNAKEFLADWDKNDGYCYKNDQRKEDR